MDLLDVELRKNSFLQEWTVPEPVKEVSERYSNYTFIFIALILLFVLFGVKK